MDQDQNVSEYWRLDYDHERDEIKFRFEMQSHLGLGALKSMMLVNGGAIISVLTFVGNKGAIAEPAALRQGMFLFIAGLICGLAAYFGAYFSQSEFMHVATYRAFNAQSLMIGGPPVEVPKKHETRGNFCLYSAIVLLLLSLGFFALGSCSALTSVL